MTSFSMPKTLDALDLSGNFLNGKIPSSHYKQVIILVVGAFLHPFLHSHHYKSFDFQKISSVNYMNT